VCRNLRGWSRCQVTWKLWTISCWSRFMLPPRYAQSRCVVLRNCWRQTQFSNNCELNFYGRNFSCWVQRDFSKVINFLLPLVIIFHGTRLSNVLTFNISWLMKYALSVRRCGGVWLWSLKKIDFFFLLVLIIKINFKK
jgi:hypothetical protein